jgi:hypothetical protein
VADDRRLPRCRVHPDTVLAVHPRRWGWICRRCRVLDQPTEQPYPFVPLPPVRPDRGVAPELVIQPHRRSAPVPPSTSKQTRLGRGHERIGPGQLRFDAGS